MPPTAITTLLSRCARPAQRDPAADADLLRRAARDRDALDELVRRYAGLVWGVCRRTLRNEADAEDAFQATFLALIRQAPKIHAGRPLAGWLHTVATRIARKAQVRALKRPVLAVSDAAAAADTTAEVSSHELLNAVDSSIARLPARLRGPIVLCCVEGLTRDEAAEALGCSVSAVKSRLERGRLMLRRLLEKRGVALPAAFLALGLGTARVSAGLRDKTVAGLTQPSPAVAELAGAPARWKLIGTCLALLATGVIGVGVLGLPRSAPPKGPPAKDATPKPVERVDRLGDPLPDAALLRLGTSRFRHPGSATALALAPDEKTVLTLGYEGLFAWDTATGKDRWSTRGHRDLDRDLNGHVGETPLVILPDSRQAVMPVDGPAFHVWDLSTGKSELRRVGDPAAPPAETFRSVTVSKDGEMLAFGGPQGVVLCDLDGKVSARIGNTPTGPRNPNQDRLLAWQDWSYPRFAPDGKSLSVATSDSETEVRLCKLDGTEIRRIALSMRYLDSAFSPDGALIAVAERDDTVRVYETATGRRKHEWPVMITRKQANENYIFKVVWSPDGKTVAAAASDKLIHLWEMPSGKAAGDLRGHGWYPWGLAFTKDSKTLYSTGWDGDIRRWDLATKKQLPLPQGIRGSALVAYAPDGRTVAYADGDGSLRLVDPKNGQERKVLSVPGLSPDQMTFSPDVRSLAVGGTSGDKIAVCVLNVETGTVTKRWDWPKGNDPHASVQDLAFSADGRRLATVSFRQNTVRVWDLTADKEAFVLKHLEGYGLAFSPDGKTLVTCGWDRKLKFWDPADGKLKKEFPVVLPKEFVGGDGVRDDVRVFGVAWSPDGTRVAATDLGGRLWIWDADTMKARAVTETKDIPRYNTIAFSPDGLWIATGGALAKALVWDAWTGQKVWERGTHKADLYKVCFGRDSRTLLSGAEDGLGYLWNLRPKDLPADAPAALWPSLVGADGPAAYRAFWAMLEKPDAAVAAVAEQGKAFTATVEPAQAKQWIADLDSPKFAAREAAEKELSARLRASVPYLRETLNMSPSAEQRSRVQKLLAEWDGLRPRWARVVSLLAHVGTPAAKDVLRSWSEADPDGDLGRAAKAALTKP